MRIKRFTAEDMATAMARVRDELGGEAVILNTREVPASRWVPWRRRKRIEIVAAVEDGGGQGAKGPAPTGPRSNPRPEVNFLSGPDPGEVGAEFTRGNLYRDPLTGSSGRSGVSGDVRDLTDAGWRELIRKIAASGESPAARALVHLAEGLVAGGMDERRARALAEQAVISIPDDGSWEISHMVEQLQEIVRSQLQPWVGSPMAAESRVIALAGPTGVGKTTTIAKLAAIETLDAGRRVALITADTYRIAAVDQLRTYAQIIGIPCFVVYTPEEMRRTVGELAEYDRIFVDTAGRNYTQREHALSLREMLQAAKPDETYLVLSLSGKGRDLYRTVEALREVAIDKYLFTKADETESLASAVDLILAESRPVAYITTGQGVPDDIIEADAAYLAQRLF
ncbi:flagellar biosynthesis protein FlhF [Kyrpidia spormannii]|uniref:Flagellar biosynthesis protein FlhF n=1 Tax=Kyrpidia spormannii TaxID=2055160 RepID=A0A2K8N6M2_9BACL|nr:flagellar biosynthesis protein FlhF [Kyrpidia spormannii]ATY85009.1 flagellar biosynthesis protein FlhF [Kyrpidia spormannii]